MAQSRKDRFENAQACKMVLPVVGFYSIPQRFDSWCLSVKLSVELPRSLGPTTSYTFPPWAVGTLRGRMTHGSLLAIACCHTARCPRPASTLSTKAWSLAQQGARGLRQPNRQARDPRETATHAETGPGGPQNHHSVWFLGGEGWRQILALPWGRTPRQRAGPPGDGDVGRTRRGQHL